MLPPRASGRPTATAAFEGRATRPVEQQAPPVTSPPRDETPAPSPPPPVLLLPQPQAAVAAVPPATPTDAAPIAQTRSPVLRELEPNPLPLAGEVATDPLPPLTQPVVAAPPLPGRAIEPAPAETPKVVEARTGNSEASRSAVTTARVAKPRSGGGEPAAGRQRQSMSSSRWSPCRPWPRAKEPAADVAARHVRRSRNRRRPTQPSRGPSSCPTPLVQAERERPFEAPMHQARRTGARLDTLTRSSLFRSQFLMSEP
jgi:hypothetical protein